MKTNYYTILILSSSVLLLVINLSISSDVNAQIGDETPVDVNVTSTFQNPVNNFMIYFLDPTTNSPQLHIDYDFSIVDTSTNKTIYKGSSVTGQEVLHTSEGKITIPYEFTRSGNYILNIEVLGLHFMPIQQKTFSFPMTVSNDLQATIK